MMPAREERRDGYQGSGTSTQLHQWKLTTPRQSVHMKRTVFNLLILSYSPHVGTNRVNISLSGLDKEATKIDIKNLLNEERRRGRSPE